MFASKHCYDVHPPLMKCFMHSYHSIATPECVDSNQVPIWMRSHENRLHRSSRANMAAILEIVKMKKTDFRFRFAYNNLATMNLFKQWFWITEGMR